MPRVAAGASGWSLSTELRALQNDPSLHIPATLVIVSNSGDLVTASRWQSEHVQPTHRPVSLLAYAIGKKLAASQPVLSPDSPTRDEWPERVGAVLAPGSRRIVWVLYPWKREVRRPVLAFDMLVKALPPAIGAFRIDGDRRWTGTDYGDHFHPSASGYAMLAAIIADRLPRCRANHGT